MWIYIYKNKKIKVFLLICLESSRTMLSSRFCVRGTKMYICSVSVYLSMYLLPNKIILVEFKTDNVLRFVGETEEPYNFARVSVCLSVCKSQTFYTRQDDKSYILFSTLIKHCIHILCIFPRIENIVVRKNDLRVVHGQELLN